MTGIHHFRYILEGRPFTLYTDHKPLTFTLSKAAEAWTARQSRHMSYIAKFTSDIRQEQGWTTWWRTPSPGPRRQY